jgi:hypothetical protein
MSNVSSALHRHLILDAALLVGFGNAAIADADPLPSWNDGAAKRAIIEFVEGAINPA